MAYLSGYTTRKKITIDHGKIDADLTDFPVLVKLTSSNFDFSKANSDGFDIRFTSSDGTTLLKYERERHDATNKLAEYWVKIPSVSSSADTSFYIYYRTTDTDDGADPTNVWDSSFKMVQHMNDKTTSTIEDSTSNNNDGTKKAANEPIQADGQIAKAQSFDGNNDYIDCGNQDSLNITGNLTLEAWFKADTMANHTLFSKVNSSDGHKSGYGIYTYSNGEMAMDIRNNNQNYVSTVSTYSTGIWYYLAGTFNSSTGIGTIYLNGAYDNEKSGLSLGSNTYNVFMGRLGGGVPWYMDGLIDEIRLSNVARSSAWIKASYNSGNNSLVSYGSEEGMDNAVFFGCNF